jgi:predicted transcriptional regulator
MQHRGEIIKKAIYESGISVTALAYKLGKSRRWVYQMFDSCNVSLDIVIKIGNLIHHDFSTEINELRIIVENNNISENDNNVDYWKNKYLKLLEDFNEQLKNK